MMRLVLSSIGLMFAGVLAAQTSLRSADEVWAGHRVYVVTNQSSEPLTAFAVTSDCKDVLTQEKPESPFIFDSAFEYGVELSLPPGVSWTISLSASEPSCTSATVAAVFNDTRAEGSLKALNAIRLQRHGALEAIAMLEKVLSSQSSSDSLDERMAKLNEEAEHLPKSSIEMLGKMIVLLDAGHHFKERTLLRTPIDVRLHGFQMKPFGSTAAPPSESYLIAFRMRLEQWKSALMADF